MEEKKDKRKETSKANMEKARLKILEERRMKKNTQQYQIDSTDSESGSSSEEEPVIMIRSKGKGAQKGVKPTQQKPENDNLKGEIEQLKQMILGMGKKKSKDKKKKRVIQILPPPQIPVKQEAPPKQDTNSLEHIMKRKILNF